MLVRGPRRRRASMISLRTMTLERWAGRPRGTGPRRRSCQARSLLRRVCSARIFRAGRSHARSRPLNRMPAFRGGQDNYATSDLLVGVALTASSQTGNAQCAGITGGKTTATVRRPTPGSNRGYGYRHGKGKNENARKADIVRRRWGGKRANRTWGLRAGPRSSSLLLGAAGILRETGEFRTPRRPGAVRSLGTEVVIAAPSIR